MFRFIFSAAIPGVLLLSNSVYAELKAGAAIVDVTPAKFPVLVNGGMTSRTAAEVTTMAMNALESWLSTVA